MLSGQGSLFSRKICRKVNYMYLFSSTVPAAKMYVQSWELTMNRGIVPDSNNAILAQYDKLAF